jgi:hypothetical protein
MQARLDPGTRQHAHPAANRGTSVWYAQGLDGSTHFLTKILNRVSTEMSLQVLAYMLNDSFRFYCCHTLKSLNVP